jgi:transposase
MWRETQRRRRTSVTGSCRLPLEVYKWRHLIENFFGKLKEFKRIALRSEKTDTSFESIIYLAATVINSR